MAMSRFAPAPSQFKSLIGNNYGRLTVVGFSEKRGKHTYWHCDCVCGAKVVRRADHMQSGRSSSCGCYNREVQRIKFEKHGGARHNNRHPLYETWTGIIKRCENENCRAYPYYGGRGITICDRWRNDFTAFVNDMGAKPEGTSIDRIDVNGNYEPGNCRWADKFTQSRNRRNVKQREDRLITTPA